MCKKASTAMPPTTSASRASALERVMSALQLLDRAAGAAQAPAQLPPDIREHLDRDGSVLARERAERVLGQDVADEILVRLDRGRARLPVEKRPLAEDGAGRERGQAVLTTITRQLDLDAGRPAHDDERLATCLALADLALTVGLPLNASTSCGARPASTSICSSG